MYFASNTRKGEQQYHSQGMLYLFKQFDNCAMQEYLFMQPIMYLFHTRK